MYMDKNKFQVPIDISEIRRMWVFFPPSRKRDVVRVLERGYFNKWFSFYARNIYPYRVRRKGGGRWWGNSTYYVIILYMRLFSQTSSTTSDPEGHWEMSNCRELLPGRLHVHWEVRDDWVQVQLTGKIREDQYMAFGLSGNQQRWAEKTSFYYNAVRTKSSASRIGPLPAGNSGNVGRKTGVFAVILAKTKFSKDRNNIARFPCNCTPHTDPAIEMGVFHKNARLKPESTGIFTFYYDFRCTFNRYWFPVNFCVRLVFGYLSGFNRARVMEVFANTRPKIFPFVSVDVRNFVYPRILNTRILLRHRRITQ